MWVYKNIGKRHQWDIFIDGRWAPVNWLTLDAGLRYISARNEYNWIHVETSQASLNAPSGGSQSDEGLVPNAGITLEPVGGLQLYGTYREGWRAPSFNELQDYIPGAQPRDYPTPGNLSVLKNERAKNIEAGANLLRRDLLRSGDTLGLKVSYFLNNVDNYILQSYARTPTGGTAASTFNIDRARFSGFEASARYDAGVVFAEASAIYYDSIKLCSSADHCFSSETDDGLPVNGWRNHVPPRYSVSATGGVRLFGKKLTLAARATFVGSSTAEAKNTHRQPNSYIWDPYTLVDIFGSYQIADQVTLGFSAENLLDKFYSDPLAMVKQPGPGRTVRMSATFQF